MGDSKRSKLWIWIAIIFLFFLLSYFFIYRNIILHTRELNLKIESIKVKIQAKKHLATSLNQYKRELIEMREVFAKFSNYLSKSSEISDYLVRLGDILSEFNIKPTVFRPGEEKYEKGKVYGSLPVSLKIKCDYFTLIKFLDKIENDDKIVYIKQIDVNSGEKNIIDIDLLLFLLLKKEEVKF